MEKYVQNLEYGEASASSKPINLELIFPTRVASPVYTGRKITRELGGDGGNESIKIMLVDSNTGQQVTNGRAASLKVKIVLIRGEFNGVTGDEGIWSPVEFGSNIVVNFGKKKNILLGDLSPILNEGSATISEIRIKHDSNPIRNVKFRLGAMVDDVFPYAIKEAITNIFDVKDFRNKSKRFGPLSPNDMVWQLVNVSRKGPIRKRLEGKNVRTVRDFLSMHYSNPQLLKEICGIKGKKWEMTVNHAKLSLLDDVCNCYGRVGSTSQQSNTISSFECDESMLFDYNCYKPRLCEKDVFANTMIADCDFSIHDVELCDMFLEFERINDMEPNGGGLAKKRWMKLRATLWFLMVS